MLMEHASRCVIHIGNDYLSYFAEWILEKTGEVIKLLNKLYYRTMALDH